MSPHTTAHNVRRLRAVSTPRTSVTCCEGTDSAELILGTAASLAGEPLLLHSGLLHRVDCRQMPPDAGVSFGALCTQKTAADTPKEKTMPEVEAEAVATAFDLAGKDYSDHHGPRPMADYHAGRALFWRCYLALVAAGLYFLAKWLRA